MRKLILTGIAGLALIAALMLAASAAAGPTSAVKATKLIVAMHEPGCHWFYLGGGPNHRQFAKAVTRTGPVTLINLDEDTLIIKGPGGTRRDSIGARLTLRAKGLYRITMVRQEPDDVTLKLTIK